MIDAKYVRGHVTARSEISSDLWIVRVRPAERIPFVAGQYIAVGLPGSARMVERPYSIASSPEEVELEFFLELVPGGELTPQLYKVPVGGEVYLRRTAKGRFVYDIKSNRPNHFMVATVTGVAPCLSMVREVVARANAGEQVLARIVLLHAASLPQEFGYFGELSAYSRQHRWLIYVPTISRVWESPGWTGERGRAEDITRKYLDIFGLTPGDTTAYVCGNPDMIENVKGVLRRAGFQKESIREEVYWLAQKG
jgi:ferredoxin--NADP+ reductase